MQLREWLLVYEPHCMVRQPRATTMPPAAVQHGVTLCWRVLLLRLSHGGPSPFE
jgi:hypothetical protein